MARKTRIVMIMPSLHEGNVLVSFVNAAETCGGAFTCRIARRNGYSFVRGYSTFHGDHGDEAAFEAFLRLADSAQGNEGNILCCGSRVPTMQGFSMNYKMLENSKA